MLLLKILVKSIILSWMSLSPVVHAGNFVDRVRLSIDQESVLKTITGISELQCHHKCRRASKCKNSAYEDNGDDNRQLSKCFLLKDAKDSNNNQEASITLHFPKMSTQITCIHEVAIFMQNPSLPKKLLFFIEFILIFQRLRHYMEVMLNSNFGTFTDIHWRIFL